jgi:N-acetyl-alpha-D-muramate 1-phosphate uridylyltransferase
MAAPKKAMVLAAGLGTRLRPMTESQPKALVEVGGKTLLDHALDRLAEAGVEDAVVNTHHLADRISRQLASRSWPRIHLSHETEILDTGGGIARALPLLGRDPFYVVNAKVVWQGGRKDALLQLAEAWNGAEMDGLLLMQPTANAVGYDGPGDFIMDQLGRLAWRPPRIVVPFVYASVQILHPRLFEGAPKGAFSLRPLWTRAMEAGRLFGLRHDGAWYHVATAAGLDAVQRELSRSGRLAP